MKAKKSLGQNFLKSASVAKKLVESANISPDDIVVEVGPGTGAITDCLLQKAKQIIAVEKDARMIEYLKQKFPQEIAEERLFLVNEDILDFNPALYKLPTTNYQLVGSIPYYITGSFLRRFLSIEPQPKSIALIIQKEVAERIIAKNGKESILSISVKAYGTPRYIQTVPRELFSPQPKVDSAILVIDSISKKFFSRFSEGKFFTLVKTGFKSKRKKLSGNLKTISSKTFPTGNFGEMLVRLEISPDARAENITLSDWKKLAQTII